MAYRNKWQSINASEYKRRQKNENWINRWCIDYCRYWANVFIFIIDSLTGKETRIGGFDMICDEDVEKKPIDKFG